MSQAKQHRWKCERCGGGVLAPSRLRRDDVRRFCLACSATSGRLVERTCPAVDARRDARAERTKEARSRRKKAERSKARVERERLAERKARAAAQAALAERERWTRGGVDLREEAERIWLLPVMQEQHNGRKRLPAVSVNRRSYGGSSGRAWGYRLHVSAGDDVGDALAVLVHELVHCAVGTAQGHSEHFYYVFRSACRDAYPEADMRWHELQAQRGRAVTTWAAGAIRDSLEGGRKVAAAPPPSG